MPDTKTAPIQPKRAQCLNVGDVVKLYPTDRRRVLSVAEVPGAPIYVGGTWEVLSSDAPHVESFVAPFLRFFTIEAPTASANSTPICTPCCRARSTRRRFITLACESEARSSTRRSFRGRSDDEAQSRGSRNDGSKPDDT